MSVMSSLWSSHLVGWPRWTVWGRPSAAPPRRLMNNQQNTEKLRSSCAGAVWTSQQRPVESSEGVGWRLSRRVGAGRRLGGGWPRDRWGRTSCQTGRGSTEPSAEDSKVLLCLLKRWALSSGSHPSELTQGKSQATVLFYCYYFFYISGDF